MGEDSLSFGDMLQHASHTPPTCPLGRGEGEWYTHSPPITHHSHTCTHTHTHTTPLTHTHTHNTHMQICRCSHTDR